MKLRAPEGCASICHDGQIFIVAADGSIEVTKAMAASLSAHGFTPWNEDEPMPQETAPAKPEPSGSEPSQQADIGRLTRAELFAFLRAHGVRGSRHDTNAQLRAKAREVLRAR